MAVWDFAEHTTNPSPPGAGKVRLFAKDDSLFIIDEFGIVTELASASSAGRVVLSAIKDTNGTIPRGKAVYVTGFDVAAQAVKVELARADADATMPAIGVSLVAFDELTVGGVLVIGDLEDVDTSGSAVRDFLHVSAITAGELAVSTPLGPDRYQRVAQVTRVDAVSGRLLVHVAFDERLSNADPEPLGAAGSGDSSTASRSNHVHGHGNQAGGTLHADAVPAGASGFMSGADKAKLDGTAVVTAVPPVDVTKAAAAVGVSADAARDDHKHDVSTAAPAIGAGGGNAEGVATSLARSDHDHALRTPLGPADLTIGDIANGQVLQRSGTEIIGVPKIYSDGVADWYIDAVGGSDANAGTIGAPFQTLERALEELPLRILPGHRQIFHCKPGTYAVSKQWPTTIRSDSILIYADEAWDPAVVNVVNSGTAEATTGASLVVAVAMGLTLNQRRDYFIEFTSGAAVGQKRMIRSNDAAGNIVPAIRFSPAPASGDTFRIFDPTPCELDFDLLDDVPWISGTNGAGIIISGVGGPIIVAGFNLMAPSGSRFAVVANESLALYGCWNSNCILSPSTTQLWFGHDTDSSTLSTKAATAALGLASEELWKGWGLAHRFVLGLTVTEHRSRVDGVINLMSGSTVNLGASFQWRGGGAVYSFSPSPGLVVGNDTYAIFGESGSPPVLIEMSHANAVALRIDGGRVLLSNCLLKTNSAAQPTILCRRGSRLHVTGSGVTGENSHVSGITMQVSEGGVVTFDAAPQLGKAVGSDYDVNSGSPQNKSFFAASGDVMASLGGAVIVRE